MTKVAIFVEGQTERKFIKKLLGQRYKGVAFIIDEISLRGGKSFIRIEGKKSAPGVDCNFLIIEVPSYDKVASTVVENTNNMVCRCGFELLLGLRDLLPNSRTEKTKVINSISRVLARVPDHDKISIILAVMETEAWFLCDWHLFERIHARLTSSYIQEQLTLDLVNDDPELKYGKPSKTVNNILRLVGLSYRKHGPEVDTVVNNIDFNYLFSCTSKIDSFFRFLRQLDRCGLLQLENNYRKVEST